MDRGVARRSPCVNRADVRLAEELPLGTHDEKVLAKGAGLCHGTAGNGFALLELFRRTGDSLWLDRARRFAMHAIEQSERMAARYGRRRYSLWTGDPGVAVYLHSCLVGRAGMPLLDVF